MDPVRAFVCIVEEDSDVGAVLDPLFHAMYEGILEEVRTYNHTLKEA